MSLSDLASLGSFVSGVAVLATLVFLLLQTRQNTLVLRRAEANATQSQVSAYRLAIVNSREVAKLLTSATSEGTALDDVDLVRFNNLMSEIMWSLFHVWQREQAGLFPKGEFKRGGGRAVAYMLSRGSGAAWWEEQKAMFPPSFMTDVEGMLASISPP